jgi:hypothetical protein
MDSLYNFVEKELFQNYIMIPFDLDEQKQSFTTLLNHIRSNFNTKLLKKQNIVKYLKKICTFFLNNDNIFNEGNYMAISGDIMILKNELYIKHRLSTLVNTMKRHYDYIVLGYGAGGRIDQAIPRFALEMSGLGYKVLILQFTSLNDFGIINQLNSDYIDKISKFYKFKTNIKNINYVFLSGSFLSSRDLTTRSYLPTTYYDEFNTLFFKFLCFYLSSYDRCQ